MLIVLLAQTEPAGAATDEQAAPRVAWWQLDASGRIQNQGVDDLLTLHQRIPQEKLRALAPASDVSLHRVSIPSRRAADGRAALPWELEERVS